MGSTARMERKISRVWTRSLLLILCSQEVGKLNSYTFDPTSANFSTFCLLSSTRDFYPNPGPTGILRTALNKNYDHFFQGLNGVVGAQLFPCGLG